MANGYYNVTDTNGDMVSECLRDFATANRVACEHVVSRGGACEIYVASKSETAEGDEPGDTWEVTANSDGYGNPIGEE